MGFALHTVTILESKLPTIEILALGSVTLKLAASVTIDYPITLKNKCVPNWVLESHCFTIYVIGGDLSIILKVPLYNDVL